MYITGAVEILLNYISPEIALFGDFEADKSILYHNIRVYGTIFLIIIGILVFIGVRFVSKFAPVALFCVLVSILSVYLGIFVNYNGNYFFNFKLLHDFFNTFFFQKKQKVLINIKYVQLVVEYYHQKIILPVLKKVYVMYFVT